MIIPSEKFQNLRDEQRSNTKQHRRSQGDMRKPGQHVVSEVKDNLKEGTVKSVKYLK
jgi:hypothetical protein